MSGKLFLRKEFIINRKQYKEIENYFITGDSDTDLITEFHYNVDEFNIVVDIRAVGCAVVDLICCVYKNNKLLNSSQYTLDDISKLSNVFMIEAEPIEFYFKFGYEGVVYTDIQYIKHHLLPQMDIPVSNMFALMKYNSLKSEELFSILIEFIYSIDKINSLIKGRTKDYVLNKLEYLKDKLSVAGYDEDYLNENYSIIKAIMSNDEILNCLIIMALDYLYNGKTDLVPNNSRLAELTKTYCDNLSKAI